MVIDPRVEETGRCTPSRSPCTSPRTSWPLSTEPCRTRVCTRLPVDGQGSGATSAPTRGSPSAQLAARPVWYWIRFSRPTVRSSCAPLHSWRHRRRTLARSEAAEGTPGYAAPHRKTARAMSSAGAGASGKGPRRTAPSGGTVPPPAVCCRSRCRSSAGANDAAQVVLYRRTDRVRLLRLPALARHGRVSLGLGSLGPLPASSVSTRSYAAIRDL
jgi:hypothetical protein